MKCQGRQLLVSDRCKVYWRHYSDFLALPTGIASALNESRLAC